MNKLIFASLFCFSSFILNGQIIKNKHRDSTDLTFKGTKINPYSQEFDSTGKCILSGYVDTYFAHYSDTVNANGYTKFPTFGSRNDQFGLNILQLSAKYQAKSFRATAAIFAGDCPKSTWSPEFNFIQEANLGFKLHRKVWLDMGFFRTHIGLESIQPRENMTLSLATTSYFEPYFMSGAKLTYEITKQWAFQLNAFNSYNQFIETNHNKAVGMSTAYTNKHTSWVFSTILSDETESKLSWRLYNNMCFSYHTEKIVLGGEANFGIQKNTHTYSLVTSGLLAAKYRLTPKIASYIRGELFIDPNEVLTGPVYNENHALVGMEIAGITHGWEYKPIPNSYVRIEGRILSNYNQHIFSYQNMPSKVRTEFTFGMGVWF